MNTLLKARELKIIALITAISFSLSLVQIPSVSASEPVADETGVSVATVPVDQPVKTQSTTTIPQDPTAQFLTEEPLSTPTIELEITLDQIQGESGGGGTKEKGESVVTRTISGDDLKDGLKDGVYELPSGSGPSIIIGGEIDTSNTKIEPAISPLPYPITGFDPSQTPQPSAGDPASYPIPSPEPSEPEFIEAPNVTLPSPDESGIIWGELPEPDSSEIPDDSSTGVGGGITVTSTVTLVGDVNGDGVVDQKDLDLVREHFGGWTDSDGNPVGGYDPVYDINHDGTINAVDLGRVRANYGHESPAITQIKAVVVSDLMNTFGFTDQMLKDLIAKGLIKIEVDLKNLTAKVTIDPSVQPPDGVVNLTDPLGQHRLPGEIHYQLGVAYPPAPGAPCTPDGGCPTTTTSPIYFLESGAFNIGSDYFVQMNFLGTEPYAADVGGDNRLHSVKIYYKAITPPSSGCNENGCWVADGFVQNILTKEITYKYDDTNGVIGARIVYYDGSQGIVSSRDVTLAKMEDGQYHIKTVTDYDSDGKLIVKSEFIYAIAIHPPCTPEGCEPDTVALVKIVRTDANGNPLSEIRDIQPTNVIAIYPNPEPAFQAIIVLPDGKEVQVIFKTFEELLAQALKVETIHSEIEALRTQLLSKVDSEIANTQKKLEDLKAQLEAAKIQLAKDLEAMRSDAEEVKNQMSAWLDALKNLLLNQEGLSDETRKAITYLSSQITNYLDPNQPNNFDQLMNIYMDQIGFLRLWSLNSQITMWEDYLGALSAYRDQVVGAKTLEDLKTLENQFPLPIAPPQIMPPFMNDPRKLAKEYIAEAMPLIEKARDEQSQYQAVQVVTNDLVNSFGFSEATVKDLIKQGLIKVEVDRKSLKAKITIDPSVTLPDQADLVYLVDLLGSHKLPKEINYQLGVFVVPMGVPCRLGYPCLEAAPSYYLNSGSFSVGTNYFELNYIEDGIIGIPELPEAGDNRLHSVKIWRNPCGENARCELPTILIKKISYTYYDIKGPYVSAHISHLDGSQGDVSSRDVVIGKFADGKDHIMAVKDYDQDGKLIAKSEFHYMVAMPMCAPDGFCPPAFVHLYEITRTDANGNTLSKITNIGPAPILAPIDLGLFQATIVLPDGTEHRVVFKTLEELFMKALRFEHKIILEPIPIPLPNPLVQVQNAFLVPNALATRTSGFSSILTSNSKSYKPFAFLKRFRKDRKRSK